MRRFPAWLQRVRPKDSLQMKAEAAVAAAGLLASDLVSNASLTITNAASSRTADSLASVLLLVGPSEKMLPQGTGELLLMQLGVRPSSFRM